MNSVRPTFVLLGLIIAVSTGPLLAGCSAEGLDCSMGAMRSDCSAGTLGMRRMIALQRLIQRQCIAAGLQPGTDPYIQCLSTQDLARHAPVPISPKPSPDGGPGQPL